MNPAYTDSALQPDNSSVPSQTLVAPVQPEDKGATPSAADIFYSTLAQTKNEPWVKNQDLNTPIRTDWDQAKRYQDSQLGFNPYDAGEEFLYGKKQSAIAKWGNALAKFGVQTVGSFASTMADIPNILNAAASGDEKKVVDNPVNNTVYDMGKWAEDIFPNYTSAWEVNHAALNWVPFIGNTGNTWGDVVLKNLGFTAGAMAGTFVTDALIGAATEGAGDIALIPAQAKKIGWGISKLLSSDETAEKLKAAVTSGDDLLEQVNRLSAAAQFKDKARYLAGMVTSASSEAASEAIQSKRDLTDKLTKDFYDSHGYDADAEEKASIDKTADEAMMVRYGLNVGLLTATNSIQFGNFFRPFSVARKAIETEVMDGEKIALKAGENDVFEHVAKNRFGKIFDFLKEQAPDNLSEAFEEGAQYWIETSTNDYYTKKHKGGGGVNDLLDSIGYGLGQSIGTSEGQSNWELGFLTGAIIHTGKAVARKVSESAGWLQPKKEIVERIVNSLNDNPLTGIFEQKYNSTQRGEAIAQQMQQAVKDGNVFSYENLKHDNFFNLIDNAIRNNAFDLRMEQLSSLKDLPEDQFKEMWGLDKSDKSAKTTGQYVDSFISKAKDIKDTIGKIDSAFVNPFKYNYNAKSEEQQKDNDMHLLFENYKTVLARSLSFMDNFSGRASQIETSLSDDYHIPDIDNAKKLLPENLTAYGKDIDDRVKDINENLQLLKGTNTATDRTQKKNLKKEAAWLENKKAEIKSVSDDFKNYRQKSDDVKDGEVRDTQHLAEKYFSLFHDLLQYQSTNNITSKPSAFNKNITTGLQGIFNKLQDHTKLKDNEQAAMDSYNELTTRKGFDKYWAELKEQRELERQSGKEKLEEFSQEKPQTDSRAEAAAQVSQTDEGAVSGLNDQYEVASEKAAGIFGPIGSKINYESFGTGDAHFYTSEKFKEPVAFPESYLIGLHGSGDLKATGMPVVGQNDKAAKVPTAAIETQAPDKATPIYSEYEVSKPGFESSFGKPGDKVLFHEIDKPTGAVSIKTKPMPGGFTLDPSALHGLVTNGTLKPTGKNINNALENTASGNPISINPTNPIHFNATSELFRTLTYADFEANTLDLISKLNDTAQLDGKVSAREAKNQNVKREPVFTNVAGSIYQKSYETTVNLYFNDGSGEKQIGVVAEPGRLHYKDISGNYIPIEQATPDIWNSLFDGVETIPPYESFMKNYTAAKLLYQGFRDGKINTDNFGEYATVRPVIAKQLISGNQQRPSVSQLDKRTFGIADPKTGKRTGVIFSITKEFDRENGKTSFEPSFHYSDIISPEAKKRIMDWVKSNWQLIMNNVENGSLKTRYFALSEFPAAKQSMQLINLHPGKLEAVNKDEIFSEIKDSSRTVASTEDAKERKKLAIELTNEINSKLFLASNLKTPRFHNMEITVNLTGGIGIEFSIPGNDGQWVNRHYNISKDVFDRIGSLDDLIRTIQEQAGKFNDILGDITPAKNIINDEELKADPLSGYNNLANNLTASTTGNVVRVRFDVLPKESIFNKDSSPDKSKETSLIENAIAEQAQDNARTVKKQEDADSSIRLKKDGTPDKRYRNSRLAPQIATSSEEIISDLTSLPSGPIVLNGEKYIIAPDYKLGAYTLAKYDPVGNEYIQQSDTLLPSELQSWLNDGRVKQFQEEDFSYDDIPFSLKQDHDLSVHTDFEKMRDIMQRELPDIIGLDNMSALLSRLRGSGKDMPEAWGALHDGTIYLNSETKPGTIYHEIFHAVFRNLLSDGDIEKYLKLAKQKTNVALARTGKSINEVLSEKRRQGLYLDLNDEQAKERIYEETMADGYQDYRNGGYIPGFFKDIYEAIKNFFRFITGNKRDELMGLFRQIKQGQFKHATLAENRYTGTPDVVTSARVYYKFPIIENGALKKDEEGKVVTHTLALSADETAQVARDVTGYVLKYRELPEFKNYSTDDLCNRVMDNLYSILKKGSPYRDAFTNESVGKWAMIYQQPLARHAITENVKDYMQAISRMNDDIIDNIQADDEEGKTASFDNKNEEKGGFVNLSSFMRSYIGLAGEEIKDSYGNLIPLDGSGKVVMKRSIDPIDVYYGVMRRLSNIITKEDKLKALIQYAKDNKSTGVFVNNFIEDTGLDKEALFTDKPTIQFLSGAPKNPTLVNQFLRAFDKARMDYVKMVIDKEQDGPKVKVFFSNKRNIVDVQFNKWAKQFNALSNYNSENSAGLTNDFIWSIKDHWDDIAVNRTYSGELDDAISNIRNDFSKIGIDLSRGYIRYSILKQKAAMANGEFASHGMQPGHPNSYITNEDLDYVATMSIPPELVLKPEVFSALLMTNPFHKAVIRDEDGNYTLDDFSGAVTRIKKLAEGNAYFDETQGESSFQNAEGKTIFAHQDVTSHVKTFLHLRNPHIRQQLKETGAYDAELHEANLYNGPVRKENWLLQDEDFNKIADSLTFFRLDGIGLQQDKKSQANIQEYDDKVFGDFGSRELAAFQMNTWLNKADTINGVLTVPHYVRVLEASNSADMVMLPLKNFLRLGNINDKAASFFINEIEKEYKRITRENNRIEAFKNGTSPDPIVENFHCKTKSFYNTETGDTEVTRSWGGRSQQLSDNIVQILGGRKSAIVQRLTEEALKNTEEKEFSSEIKDQLRHTINSELKKQADAYVQQLWNNGIINQNSKGETYSPVLDKRWFTGSDKHDLGDNFSENVLRFYLNNLINNWSFNQLNSGDPATMYKNDGGIDVVKRNKGKNAAISSMSILAPAPELGIHEIRSHFSYATFAEPKGWSELAGITNESDKETDRADAQMYATPEFVRYFLYSQGKLTKSLAEVLDKIDRGERVPDEAIFGKDGMIEKGTMLNSIKLVYNDPETYLKMSVVMLAPQLTTDKDGHPRPGREALHHMRLSMQQRGIDVVSPLSASKTFTTSVAMDISGFSDLQGRKVSADYFGLQQETPSNKISITTPTQLMQIIDTEQDDDQMVNINGQDSSVGKIKQLYQKALADKFTNDYVSTRNSIYSPHDFEQIIKGAEALGKMTPELGTFAKHALQAIRDSGGDAQLQDMFEPALDGSPRYDLNAPFSRDKFVQLYLAYFSKSVFSSKSPGYAAALMSDFGMKVIKQATKIDTEGNITDWKVIRQEQYDTGHNGIQSSGIRDQSRKNIKLTEQELADFNDGKAFYYTDELEHNVPEYKDGKITGYYTECMMPAHFSELASLQPHEDIPQAISHLFGIRIPSQDKHSFISLKLVDFLPAYYGSTIITAKELVKLSGADFDIDKLYLLRHDHYTTKNENGTVAFQRYGDAATADKKFEEYRQWNLKNNKALKTVRADLYDRYYKRALDEITSELQTTDTPLRKHDLFKERERLNEQLDEQAMEKLKLPTTQAGYEKFLKETGRDLNGGTVNNSLLDTIFALQNNRAVNDVIAQTPASLSYLKELSANKDYKDGSKSIYGETIDAPADSPLGQLAAHRNNTTGKDNIGVAVSGEKAFTLLSKAAVALKQDIQGLIHIGDWHFTGFGKTITSDGKRIMDMYSTLVSAATDEAKEQLNAYFRLGVDQIRLVSTMVGGGCSLENAINWVNQPVIREFLRLKDENKQKKFEDLAVQALKNVSELHGNNFDTAEEGQRLAALNSDTLLQSLRGAAGMSNTISRDDFRHLQHEIIGQLEILQPIAVNFYKVNRLLNINKALPSDWEGIDEILQTEDDLKSNSASFNIIPAIAGKVDDKLAVKYVHQSTAIKLKALKELDAISSKAFIERTPTFRYMMNGMLGNLSQRVAGDFVARKELMRELMQYLQIAAYKQRYKATHDGKFDESFRPSLIYGTEGKSIIDILREGQNLKPDNAVLKYLFPVPNTRNKYNRETKEWEKVPNPENKDGINKLEMSTRAYIDGARLENLTIGFIELYQDPETRPIYNALLHYLMVKDGLLYKNGSFLKVVPISLLQDYFTGLSLANRVLSFTNNTDAELWMATNQGRYNIRGYELNQTDEEHIAGAKNRMGALFHATFGADKMNLVKRFVDIYSTDVRHSAQLPFIKPSSAQSNFYANGDSLHVNLTTMDYEAGKKEQFKKHLDESIEKMEKAGFKVVKENLTDDKQRSLLKFPHYIRTSDGIYQLTALKKYYGKETSDPATILDDNTGTSATYQRVNQVGTFNSTNIANVETEGDKVPVYNSKLKSAVATGTSTNLISDFLSKNPESNFTYDQIAKAFGERFAKNDSLKLEEYLDALKCSGTL